MLHRSRFFRSCRTPNSLRCPRPRAHLHDGRPSEPFPPHAPLGFFHSMHQMTGIPRHRTPLQFARLTKVEPLTPKGVVKEWIPRLGRRIAEERKAAEEWKNAPWNPHEVVGPWQFGRVVENEFWECERQRAEKEKRRKENGRNGAVPRPSAPQYRQPLRRPSLFRYGIPSEPLHARSFSSSSISTPFKLTPLAVQSYSTTTLARKNVLRNKFPQDTKVDLEQIMKDFRDLELLELIKGARPKSESTLFILSCCRD